MPKTRFLQAIIEAQKEEMARDENVIVIGEDVRLSLMGGTVGLHDEFGADRVIDTPISEAGFTGMAIGLALEGFRPVVEYQIGTLPYVAWDQLINQAMKMRYMMGGQVKVPVTFRVTASGAPGGMAGQHSDHMWPALINAGMKVVVPSTPWDMKGLLKSAIRDDDPVIVFESGKLMSSRGEVPETDEVVPLGQAAVRREGGDVTIVANGYLVGEALKAADELAKDGFSAEVIDPRTLWPLDIDTIMASVSKTRRLVVADDANRLCGFAGEIISQACEQVELLSRPVRITRSGFLMPYARELEAELTPGTAELLDGARRALDASVTA